jgi:fused signal recognition particle receptor
MSWLTGYRKAMSKDTAQRPPLWRRFLGQSPEKEAASPAEGSAAPPAPKAETEAARPEAERAAPQSWWQRLKKGLRRSSSGLSASVGDLFTKRKLDAETLEEFEDALLRADLGVDTAARIVKAIASGRYGRELDADAVKRILAEELEALLAPVAKPLVIDAAHKPFVIMVVGVNGSGKTTTIGKLGSKLAQQGRSVMLAAGDTFRAAAIDQLRVWGERIGAPVVAREQGADAAGLAFDALAEAKQQGRDVLLLDTAGRLQNRAELMGELEKILRVIRKIDASAPHAVLLVLDATVGQNALSQVEIFQKTAGVTGLVMTKLDGTARGGILVAIAQRFGLPIHLIGVGEGVEDLEAFSARDFANALAGLDEPTVP